MAYADRTTMLMSALATEYYDRVRFEVWREYPIEASEVESVLTDAEMLVLDNFFASNMSYHVGADWFRWNVAKVAWNEYFEGEPFPFENEEPFVYDVPCCEQYVRHRYLQSKFPVTMGSDRVTVSSAADTTTAQVRYMLAQNVLGLPLVLTPCGDPLAFPIPKVRQLEFCVGDEEHMQSILSEAASILGPEFTLSCSFGGRRRAVLTLGLAPGIDHNNENVILRARNPIAWLLDWWKQMLRGDNNLTEHLHHLARQRFNRSEEYHSQVPKDMIHRLEGAFADMSRAEILMAFEAQEQEIDDLIWDYVYMEAMCAEDASGRAHTIMDIVERSHTIVSGITNREDRLRAVQVLLHETAVNFVVDVIIEAPNVLSGLMERLDGFVRNGSVAYNYVRHGSVEYEYVRFPSIYNEHSRLKAVQDALSSVSGDLDETLGRWRELLQRSD